MAKKPVREAIKHINRRPGYIPELEDVLEFLNSLKFLSLRDKLIIMYAYSTAIVKYPNSSNDYKLEMLDIAKGIE